VGVYTASVAADDDDIMRSDAILLLVLVVVVTAAVVVLPLLLVIIRECNISQKQCMGDSSLRHWDTSFLVLLSRHDWRR